MTLPHTTAAVPVARALVRTALAEDRPEAECTAAEAEPGAASYRDTAELLTAELVANALEHTRADGPIKLVVQMLPGGCRVEVHDGEPMAPGAPLAPPPPQGRARGPQPAPPDTPDPWQEHGRGLLLLRTLSSSCGHRPTDSGKAVWFTLSSLPGPRRRAE